MHSLTVFSPAKVNLYLRVLGRRKDGYHRILTLFHRISLGDTLRLARRPEGFRLKCSGARLPTGPQNLVTRAFRLLRASKPSVGGVSVFLRKKIPIGSGLGGGSSNAASFLLGMKRLYQLKLSSRELLKIGRKLGADVPFFLSGIRQGIGTGRGDEIHPRPAKRRHWFVLVLSSKGLSTKKVYEALPRGRKPPSLTKVSREVTMLCDFLEGKNFKQVGGWLRNDLELPAFYFQPSLKQTLLSLNQEGIEAARMSGSGPTLFAILSTRREAEQLAGKLRRRFPSKKILVCHSF